MSGIFDGQIAGCTKNKAARLRVNFDYMSASILTKTHIGILVRGDKAASDNRRYSIGCGPAKLRTFVANLQKGLAGNFSGAVQGWRIAHVGNQIIKVLDNIFMKRADKLVAKVHEKSTHHQVDADAREDDNHQKLGEYRTYDSVKKINPHNFR